MFLNVTFSQWSKVLYPVFYNNSKGLKSVVFLTLKNKLGYSFNQFSREKDLNRKIMYIISTVILPSDLKQKINLF